jgi:hypothetical protein
MPVTTSRARLLELTAEWKDKGPAAFAMKYAAAALVGIGRVSNVVEEKYSGASHTQPIALITSLPEEKPTVKPSVQKMTPAVGVPIPGNEWLVEKSGNTGMVWFVPYSASAVLLGRLQSNHLVIAEPSISALHCNFRWTELRKVNLIDAGASNGVWINRMRLRKGTACQLQGGEEVLLGRFLFRFMYSDGLAAHVRAEAEPK